MSADFLTERTVQDVATFQPKSKSISTPPLNSIGHSNYGATTPPVVTSMEELLASAAFENTAVAVEAERRRASALLKSNVIESLKLLLFQVKFFEQTLEPDPATQLAISVLSSLVRQVLQQAQDLEASLYPKVLEAFGLAPALETLVNQAMCNNDIQISLNLEQMTERLPSQIELTLFRITQDTLYCAIHQAHASQVNICLERCKESLIYSLADDGILVTGEDLLPATRQRVKQLGGLIETHVGRHHGFELVIKFSIDQPVPLTSREMEVIQLVAEGFSTKEIARLLSLTARTVNFHLNNIYTKLGVSSRTEAAIYALHHGWARRGTDF